MSQNTVFYSGMSCSRLCLLLVIVFPFVLIAPQQIDHMPAQSTLIHLSTMGGHSAWKKRAAAGGLSKDCAGGAILRHHPRLGRKGKDLALNRLGNIGGRPNPKNKRARARQSFQVEEHGDNNHRQFQQLLSCGASRTFHIFAALAILALYSLVAMRFWR